MTPGWRVWSLRLGFLALMMVLWSADDARPAPGTAGRWYKGNLHTHTTHSDGDSPPDVVAGWYKRHGYQFLVLSDHNYFTDPKGLNTVFGAPERFLLLGGEEVTSHYRDKAVHVNAYGISALAPPREGSSVVETIQLNVDAVLAAGGMPSLNHPNFRWSITPEELAQVDRLALFEVYNGHPQVHNEGGGGCAGLDAMWDVALAAGRRLHAVAVDDAHHFQVFGPQYSNPGRGWVMVRAADLSDEAIWAAIAAGEFYASTGGELAEVTRGPRSLRVSIRSDRDFRYTTRFLGRGGRVLEESLELESEFVLAEGEPYVRAVVTDSMGRRAWVQPVFAR